MQPFIFISCDGQTKLTDRHKENMKVLGFGVGENAWEAFESFMSENEHITRKYYDEVYCFPLAVDCNAEGEHWFLGKRDYFSIQKWTGLPNPLNPS